MTERGDRGAGQGWSPLEYDEPDPNIDVARRLLDPPHDSGPWLSVAWGIACLVVIGMLLFSFR